MSLACDEGHESFRDHYSPEETMRSKLSLVVAGACAVASAAAPIGAQTTEGDSLPFHRG